MKLLDGISDAYRRGKHPEPKEAKPIAELLARRRRRPRTGGAQQQAPRRGPVTSSAGGIFGTGLVRDGTDDGQPVLVASAGRIR